MSQQIDMDAVIEELRKDWHKGPLGAFRSKDGPVCLMGAAARVAGVIWTLDAYALGERLFEPIIREQFPDRRHIYALAITPDFNDHRDTTLDDVILVCEKARAAQGECHE